MRTLRRFTMVLIVSTVTAVVADDAKADADAFQQLTNYLTTGNPLQESNAIGTARIYDRTGCVSGIDDKQGGQLRIYWNNVDPATIEIKHHYFPRDEFLGTSGGRSLVLILAGDKPVVDSQVENAMLYLSLAISGVTEGRHTRVMLPVFNLDPDRLQRALDILYSRYCTGTKSEAAF